MKVLVKVINVQDNIVTYQEVTKTGRVMIEDCNTVENFIKALESKNFGFTLFVDTKAQAVSTMAKFGIEVVSWYYCRAIQKFECSITVDEFDNGYGYMVDQFGLNAFTHADITTMAISTYFEMKH